MVQSQGHQDLITHGCGHVLTVPHVVVDGDEAEGAVTRSTSAGIPSTALLGRPTLRQHLALGADRSEAGRSRQRVNANLDGTPEHRAILAPED